MDNPQNFFFWKNFASSLDIFTRKTETLNFDAPISSLDISQEKLQYAIEIIEKSYFITLLNEYSISMTLSQVVDLIQQEFLSLLQKL